MGIHWQRIDDICPQIDCFSDLEISRLSRLSAPQADRFSRTRTFLRQVLGQYLLIHPRSVEIIYTPRGKPLIKDSSIYFNLSHSQNMMVVALHDRCPVGIDLEQIKPRPFTDLINRYFSLEEQRWFQKLADSNLADQFYRSWVSKEAYTKLLEIPLLEGLKQLNTIPLLEVEPYLKSIKTGITIEEIVAPEGYKCALAYGTFELEG